MMFQGQIRTSGKVIRRGLEVLHQAASGRVRVKSHFFYRRKEAKFALEQAIRAIQAVESVSGNPLTGSLLIRFNPQLSPLEQLLIEVDYVVRTFRVSIRADHRLEKATHASVPPSDHWLRRITNLLLAPVIVPTASSGQMSEASSLIPPHAAADDDWHTLSADAIFQRLSSSSSGLSHHEANLRLDQYGFNQLMIRASDTGFWLFINQFRNIPVAMLGVSAVISIATGGIVDAVVIMGVVLINGLIGFLTERSAEKTINALGHSRPELVNVLRDGMPSSIPFEQIVPGDLLLLGPGSFISSDARLVASSNLTVDESSLTGESHPSSKNHEVLCRTVTPIGERTNMVYMGTTVTGGNALALVTVAGQATELGKIQSLVNDVEMPETQLQQQLNEMGRVLALSSAGICGLLFVIGIMRGVPWLNMLNSAISLAVAAVPEGLPTVATTTLALGIREMKRRNVLIRRLPAVESLGSIQTLCLDKTGTLTMNDMKVVVISAVGSEIRLIDGCNTDLLGNEPLPIQRTVTRLLEIVSLCSEVTLTVTGMPDVGSSTESALIHVSLSLGVNVAKLRKHYPIVRMEHRAEGRPYMVSIHACKGSRKIIAIKGSPTHVLALCTDWESPRGRKRLTERDRKRILSDNDGLAGDALRVLGVARGMMNDDQEVDFPASLVWLGLIGMEDVLRPDTPRLISQFHQAGIDTVMITGDQAATARSVGKRLGLNGDGEIVVLDSTELGMLGHEWEHPHLKTTHVFARVSPADKLRIVQALQGNGQIIAMTGDGINDGPALKASDIGVAMGRGGTDVARAVADVVLKDDNLHTMIAAVEQGRTIYSNIRKSLRFLLATNLSEIQVMLFSTTLGFKEALTPMQLLWINLVTDVFPALALAVEPPEHDVLRQAPRNPGDKIISGEDGIVILRESLLITVGAVMVFLASQKRYGSGRKTSTNTFMTLTVSQIFQAISNRSEKTTVLDMNRPGNPWMVAAASGTLGIQVLTLVYRPLRHLLQLDPIGARDMTLILGGAVIPFVLKEGFKLSSRYAQGSRTG